MSASVMGYEDGLSDVRCLAIALDLAPFALIAVTMSTMLRSRAYLRTR